MPWSSAHSNTHRRRCGRCVKLPDCPETKGRHAFECLNRQVFVCTGVLAQSFVCQPRQAENGRAHRSSNWRSLTKVNKSSRMQMESRLHCRIALQGRTRPVAAFQSPNKAPDMTTMPPCGCRSIGLFCRPRQQRYSLCSVAKLPPHSHYGQPYLDRKTGLR